MRVHALLVAILMVVLSLGVGVGCKSAEDKLCDHMKGLLEAAEMGERYSEEECNEEITEIKQECSNPDEVFECFLDKDDLEQLDGCEEVCDEVSE